jgi:hypothetical protein
MYNSLEKLNDVPVCTANIYIYYQPTESAAVPNPGIFGLFQYLAYHVPCGPLSFTHISDNSPNPASTPLIKDQDKGKVVMDVVLQIYSCFFLFLFLLLLFFFFFFFLFFATSPPVNADDEELIYKR